MNAAMNVGMLVFEIHAAAVDYDLRYLRGSRIVQVNQGLAIYDLTKHGEIFADSGHVKAGLYV